MMTDCTIGDQLKTPNTMSIGARKTRFDRPPPRTQVRGLRFGVASRRADAAVRPRVSSAGGVAPAASR